MPAPTSYKLNNGLNIPTIGFGTWQAAEENDGAYNAVKAAIAAGYRHIDTAFAYSNEKEVGRAIRDAIKENGLKREDIFVTTKLAPSSARPSYVAGAFERSFNNLDIGYVDLYLMHWPIALDPESGDLIPRNPDGSRKFDKEVNGEFEKTWEAMEPLVGDKLRAIGVSNFSIPNLERLLKKCKIVPAVNQIELHPYNPQFQLLEYCSKKGIHVTAYSPLGSTKEVKSEDGTTQKVMFGNKVLGKIAEAHKVSVAQILISWGATRGSVLPKSVTPERIQSNIQIVDLSDKEKAEIDDISKTDSQRFVKPDWGVPVFDEDFE